MALEVVPLEVWRREVRSPSAQDRSAAADLDRLLDAIDSKLDHLEGKQSAFPRATTSPANDDCAQAIAVGNESVAASTLGATNDGTASCGASATSPDVWFKYVAPAAGLVSFKTSSSSYDPVLSLFDGCPGSGGVELACDDDSGGTIEAQIVRDVSAGEQVWVRVSGYSGATGDLTLTMKPSSGITGTVTKEVTGEPLEGVQVRIWASPTSLFPTQIAVTDAAGAYTATGLEPGTYYADTSGPYAREIFQEVSCPTCSLSDGTPISVGPGAIVGNVDFTLAPLGTIAGQVTASDPASPSPAGMVYVWYSNGQFAASADIGLDGSYRVPGLAPGPYFVSTETYTHLDELYDGIYCPDNLCDQTTGTPVQVEAGKTTSEIDFVLEDLSTIQGTVVRSADGVVLPYATVNAVSEDGQIQRVSHSDGTGPYVIGAVPPGNYFVYTETGSYLGQVWPGIPCPPGCDVSAGNLVTVPVASDVTGIDFSIDELGKIEGSVYSKRTGLPISNLLEVTVMKLDGAPVDSTYIGNGRFTIDKLLSGSYLVRVEDVDTPWAYQTEVYDNLPCQSPCDLSEATPVGVALNSSTTGIDFYLSECTSPSFETFQNTFFASSSVFEEACETLTLGPNVTIPSIATATFRAGKSVVLGNGFVAQSGAHLRIEIDPNLSTGNQ